MIERFSLKFSDKGFSQETAPMTVEYYAQVELYGTG